MQVYNQVVFDDTVSGTTPVYTRPQFESLLGSANKNLYHAVLDGISGTSSLVVNIEHSNDGKNWITKTSNAYVNNAISAGSLVSDTFSDASSLSLAMVRLKLTGTSSGSTRVRVMACGRDY